MKLTLTKHVAAISAAAALTLALPLAALAGYEPANRPVKVYNGPNTPAFTYPVFNSWTNTSYGDERAFVDAATSTGTQYKDNLAVKPGETVTVRMYLHNGAAPDLNGTNFDGPGVARNSRVQVFLPTATSQQLRSFGYVIADNTNPGWVADSVDFNSTAPIHLDFVPGSARLSNRANPSGVQLSDSIVNHDNHFNPAGPAAPVGFQKMDGNFPGCFEFAAFVTLQVKVSGPSISLTKKVGQAGGQATGASISANQGDTLGWLLTYKNTSNQQVDHVTVRDTLPAHLELVPGSAARIDSNNPNGQPIDDNSLFTAGGVDVGSLGANGGGYVRYRTKVKSDLGADECNPTVVNKAFARAQGIKETEAEASATIVKACVGGSTTPITPVTPVVAQTPQPLPATGMETAAGLATASTALGYAGRHYLRSKRALVNSLRNR